MHKRIAKSHPYDATPLNYLPSELWLCVPHSEYQCQALRSVPINHIYLSPGALRPIEPARVIVLSIVCNESSECKQLSDLSVLDQLRRMRSLLQGLDCKNVTSIIPFENSNPEKQR